MEAIFEHPPCFRLDERVYVRHTGCTPSLPTTLAKHIGRHGTVIGIADGMYTVALDKCDNRRIYDQVEHMEAVTLKFYAVELQHSNM